MKRCNHKYIFKGNNSFYYHSSRNFNTYVTTDHYFCEKCLDNMSVSDKVELNLSDIPYKLPDWACNHKNHPVILDFGFGEFGMGGYIRCAKCLKIRMFVEDEKPKKWNEKSFLKHKI